MESWYPEEAICDIEYPEDEMVDCVTSYEQRAMDINVDPMRLWTTNQGPRQYDNISLVSFLYKAGCPTSGTKDQLIQRLHSYLCTGD